MTRITFIILFFSAFNSITGQNIGIGTTTPVSMLHAATNTTHVFTVENTNSLATGVGTGINFAAGINGPSGIKYTGAIRTIGSSTSEARLGLFTFAGYTPGDLVERLTILDNGKVGIGNTNPQYNLSVNGSGYFTSYVGIQTLPSPSYALSVVGPARYYDDLRIDGILNPNNTLAIGNNTTIEGTLTVQNGKGIVRSTSTTQMKIKRSSISLSGNFGAGVTIESGYYYWGEDFTDVSVFVGDAITGTGDWAKVLVVAFEVDEVNDRCKFRLTNVASSSIIFEATWAIVMIGN